MESNSYTLQPRCGNTTTTNCVSYQGPDIPCLGITTGCVLTDVECSIANQICTLVGITNVSSIVLPDCFVTAWGTQDETILNFLNFILQQACTQQELLASVIAGTTPIQGLNPMISIGYPTCQAPNSCTPTPCGGTTNVTFSQHILNVLNCICNLYSLIGTIPGGYTTVGCSISALIVSITAIINHQVVQDSAIAEIQSILRVNLGQTVTVVLPSPPNPPAGC